MKTGKCVNTCYGHSGCINVLQMASNLISASNDKTIKIWNYKNGQCIFTLKDHWNEIKCLKCIDKDTLASGSVDHFIKLWSIKTGKCLNTLKGHSEDVCCIEYTSNDILISGSVDNTIKVWNISTGKCLRTLEGLLFN